MKIIVFCNGKDYLRLSKNGVLDELRRYYKAEAERTRLKWGERLTEMLDKLYKTDDAEMMIFSLDTVGENQADRIINEIGCDIIVTYGLAGFGSLTLTDNYAYNLIAIPQIHFCTDKEKDSLTNVLAINMFFCNPELI